MTDRPQENLSYQKNVFNEKILLKEIDLMKNFFHKRLILSGLSTQLIAYLGHKTM
jgi:hypothetical protein